VRVRHLIEYRDTVWSPQQSGITLLRTSMRGMYVVMEGIEVGTVFGSCPTITCTRTAAHSSLARRSRRPAFTVGSLMSSRPMVAFTHMFRESTDSGSREKRMRCRSTGKCDLGATIYNALCVIDRSEQENLVTPHITPIHSPLKYC
jgi:hypothetical protein